MQKIQYKRDKSKAQETQVTVCKFEHYIRITESRKKKVKEK